MSQYFFVLAAISYATIVPGFVAVESFFSRLRFWKKIPLYLVLSILISTYFTYASALFIGFTRTTVLINFLVFIVPFLAIFYRRRAYLLRNIRIYFPILLAGFAVFAIFALSLYPAIFTQYEDVFIMSGPNWQDTAMHLSIIESLAEGNFPPQAPYFSGQPLTYYYFSDLHASIINAAFGNFLPRVLVIINPFLAATFFFSVFALCYQISRRQYLSIMGGIMAVLYGSMGFAGLIIDLIQGKGGYLALIAENAYHQSDNLLKMTPMADYFLQNRPMMVGLPVFVVSVILLLSIKNYGKDSRKYILLAGLITAALIKFQLFGFGIVWLFSVIFFGVNIISRKIGLRQLFTYFALYSLPSLLFYFLFATTKIDQRSILTVFIETFRLGPWDSKPFVWYLMFILVNLNLGFVVFIVALFVKGVWTKKSLLPITLTALVLMMIPLSVTFTIYSYDMFKFFYYLIPCLAVAGVYLFSLSKFKKLAFILFGTVLMVTSFTSVNILFHSHLNKANAYSYESFVAGMWIRSNTPKKSVFLTSASVHSAPTDIGGRLRVLSYITWPHSHGFNTGVDNVFSRLEDMTHTYSTGDISSVKLKYGTKYIYYGEEERSEFPEAGILFSQNDALRKVYATENISIYEIL